MKWQRSQPTQITASGPEEKIVKLYVMLRYMLHSTGSGNALGASKRLIGGRALKELIKPN
jgi:hypothetical protein